MLNRDRIKCRVYEAALLFMVIMTCIASVGCSMQGMIGLTKDLGEGFTAIDNRYRYGKENPQQYRTYQDHVNGTWSQQFKNFFRKPE